ncbi:hypothetical protein POSPLADRAFT_1040712 [Postia placenta MAD-698-R-SB12]|uniref:Uncharacterized protein n=1 Tax=Postia placenta MAD-698-R-SB12 TaxID=670580 RepID=A0A1X6MTW4_9APHY|nr:hypothetical protein POSPLADRAFT_1040712 [Postia placenta MAD-698-R-SB12]OSX59633.1 hypothetical protein POSPLADRAFT_1040712 [Postia placenta MAD-698-R-SB12]
MKHREHIRVKWRWRAGLSPSPGSLPALPDHKDVWSSIDPDLYLPSSSSSESFAFALLLQREAIIGLVTSITLKDNTEPNPLSSRCRGISPSLLIYSCVGALWSHSESHDTTPCPLYIRIHGAGTYARRS